MAVFDLSSGILPMLTFGGAAIGLLFLTDGFLFLDGSSGGFDTGGELR